MQQRLPILFDVIKHIEVQMLNTPQPAVKFAGFIKRERNQDNRYRGGKSLNSWRKQAKLE